MDNIVKVNNISFEYITDEAKLKAIDNLSLDVKKGEFVAIIGHNGSGKSTLSKNLNAILMKEIFLLMIWILKKKKDYGI